ncbi:MAG: leucine-rich repeat domain-containing protein [Bacteroidales bacterium]|nr:leucine-rich repeat domain-containing protein [Bacteroidales bacterium]
MKKTLLILAVMMMVVAVLQSAMAQDFSAVSPSGHTLYYNIVNGEAQVTSENPSPGLGSRAYENLRGNVIVPDSVTHNDITYPVTSLGLYAFMFCTDLKHLSLPSTMRVIGPYSISACQSLDSVSMPNTLQVIDTGAFSASSIKSIRIPDAVTVIRYRAFRNCGWLKSVTLHNGITTIEAGAFSWCSCLPDLMIPSTVTIETATSADNAAFYKVQHIEYHGSSTGAPWGAFWMNGLRDGDFIFNGPARDTLVSWKGTGSEVTIPSMVKVLNNSVFYNTGLRSVTMPSTMTSIGERVFQGCNLTEITLPDSLNIIGPYAFYESSGLTSLTIPDAVTTIGENAFYYCEGLTSITLGSGLTSIGSNAFYGCTGVESITIPDPVASIGSSAFYNVPHIEYHGNATGAPWGAQTMNGVREGDFLYYDTTHTTILAYLGNAGRVTVPNGVTTIGAGAFEDNTNLYMVELPNTVTVIEEDAFSGCTNLLMVTMPDTMESIGRYVFYNCRNLTSISLPYGLTAIPNWAFFNCMHLTSVTLPASLRNIGNYVFYGCTGLTSVIIPEGVESINKGVFFGCESLTTVTLPSTMTNLNTSVFSGCTALEEITSNALTAPTPASANTFNNVDSNVVVNIPCGSLASYQAVWTRFHNFNETSAYVFSATSADPTMGTVTVLTTPSCEDTAAVVEATPAVGNLFVRWNDGNTDNPRTLVVTADTHLVAHFAMSIHDTTYVNVHDTTYMEVHDTTFVTLTDTIYIYIHDTVYVGVNDAEVLDVKVYASNGQIVIEGAEGNSVMLFDISGRQLEAIRQTYDHVVRFNVPVSGTYIVKIGNYTARKIVVIR